MVASSFCCDRKSALRRISCHGRNHSQASCEYSLTFFFVDNTTASTRCLVQNFQLICYSQRVNATSQCNNVAVRVFKMAEPDGIVAVVKHCWLLVQGRRGCRERSLNTTTGLVFKKILACSVSRRVIVIA